MHIGLGKVVVEYKRYEFCLRRKASPIIQTTEVNTVHQSIAICNLSSYTI